MGSTHADLDDMEDCWRERMPALRETCPGQFVAVLKSDRSQYVAFGNFSELLALIDARDWRANRDVWMRFVEEPGALVG